MGLAVKKTQRLEVRQRRDKVLKNGSCLTGNLSAFAARVSLVEATMSNSTSTPAQSVATPRHSSNYIELAAQPSDQVAANSDTAVDLAVARRTATLQNQIATAIVGCLCLGTTLGYHWSNSVSGIQTLPALQGALSVESRPEHAEPDDVGNATSLMGPQPQELVPEPVDPPIDASALKAEFMAEKAALLREIKTLENWNNSLGLEVDLLRNESTELNAELLQLELQFARLKFESEPSTKTRIVYNFVNVPIGGGSTNVQTGSVSSSTRIQSESAWNNDSLPDSANRLGLPVNKPDLDDEYSASNQDMYDEEMYGQVMYDEEMYDEEMYDQELYDQELYDQQLYEERLYEQMVYRLKNEQ
ncbi:MAG: hypothetical protein AB8B64_17790 [Granulosicoccus sp.]